jgi:sulfotransferase family protein
LLLIRERVMFAPVFLLAPGRCFSSLVSSMLGQHPQLYAVLETQLLTRDWMEDWLADFGEGIHAHGTLRAIAEIMFGAQTDATIRKAWRWLDERRDATTGEVLTELAEALTPLVLVEKTPMLTYRPEHMARAARMFPHARFIHLVRHPAGYGMSLLEFFRQRAPLRDRRRIAALLANPESIFYKLLDRRTNPPRFDPQHAWCQRQADVLAFTSSLPASRTLRVRAEDLLATPEQNLKLICSWLDLPTNARALDDMLRPERSPFACLGPWSARFGADPNFLANPSLRLRDEQIPPLSASMPWSRAGESFSNEVRALADQLGY